MCLNARFFCLRDEAAGERAQTLIVALWVLLILAISAASIGHRVSIALRLSDYQADKLAALSAAHTAVQVAIGLLEANADSGRVDTLNDTWAENEAVFARIGDDSDTQVYASVGYTDENGKNRSGLMDEEGKLNINTASKQIIACLFEKAGILESSRKAEAVAAWRGTAQSGLPPEASDYSGAGYACKGKPFSNTHELILVKGLTRDDCRKLETLITVYGEGKININTVSLPVLLACLEGICRQSGIDEQAAGKMSDKLIAARKKAGYFSAREDIEDGFKLTGDEQRNVFFRFLDMVVFRSDNFFIEAAGYARCAEASVKVIYSRKARALLYSHES